MTAFFREPQAYELLAQSVIPELIANKKESQPLRIWVPSCATGEEAYSIAILLHEAFEAAKLPTSFQIFASDINEKSIGVARRGVYPSSIASDVSEERLKKFFRKADDSHFQVSKAIRDSIVFSQQNVITDAPFSKLDLISCRNLLIYLEPETQQKLIALFQFVLLQDGFLFLGPSESIGRNHDVFETISKKWRVFRRIGPIGNAKISIPVVTSSTRLKPAPQMPSFALPKINRRKLVERIMLTEFTPAAVLVNPRLEILFNTGPVINYLEFPTGEPTKDLLAMARPGLRSKLRSLCEQALELGTTATDSHIRVKRNGQYIPCSITVRPIHGKTKTNPACSSSFKNES